MIEMESRVGRMIPRKPFYKRKLFGLTLLFLLFMLAGAATYYVMSVYNFAKNISKPSAVKTTDEYDWSGTDRINIALFGVDARDGDANPRSDTIMILSIDPQTKNAALFSVMRDTYYNIPGHGFRKINEAYALGGPQLAIDTLKKFLQINKIPYYVKTDFNGFAKIVDALGGIDMYVEKDMYHYDDGIYNINLKKGQQHLDGKHALMYVRYRSDSSDYVRTERQRKFLKTLASELKTTNAVLKLPDILKSVQGDIETNMSFSDMLKIGKLANDLNLNSMETVQLPPTTDITGNKPALLDTSRNGASVIIPDVYQTRLLVHKILGDGVTVARTYDDQEPMVHESTPSSQPVQSALPPTPPVPKAGNNSGGGKGTGDKPGTGGNKPGETTPPGGNTGADGNQTGGKKPGGTPTDGTGGSGTNTGSGNQGTPGTGSGSPPTPPAPPPPKTNGTPGSTS
jgi:LCP family protein required for cell wall assembly